MIRILAALFLMAPVTPIFAAPFDQCGGAVDGRSELVGDLDCSDAIGPAVILSGRLDLNGFTLTSSSSGGYAAVLCEGACKIVGPGTISGGLYGIYGEGGVSVKDTTITGAASGGVVGDRIRIATSTIQTSGGQYVVLGGDRILLSETTVDATMGGTTYAVAAARVTLKNSDVVGGGIGVYGFDGNTKLVGSSITGSRRIGVTGFNVKLVDSSVTGTGLDEDVDDLQHGVHAASGIRLSNSIVSGNQGFGMIAHRVIADASTLGGNGLSSSYCTPLSGCADIIAYALPRLSPDTTCGRSSKGLSGNPWGVCIND